MDVDGEKGCEEEEADDDGGGGGGSRGTDAGEANLTLANCIQIGLLNSDFRVVLTVHTDFPPRSPLFTAAIFACPAASTLTTLSQTATETTHIYRSATPSNLNLVIV